MRYFFALLLPCSAFFSLGRPLSGALALVMQFTGIGWVIGAIWALITLANEG